MMTYREPAFDDTTCATCGARLPEPVVGAWSFDGFCHSACAVVCAGGFTLMGATAIELAQRESTCGGPGFERSLIRDWLAGATDNAPAMLARISAEADTVGGSPDSWCWRLYSGGVCRFMRLTAKPKRMMLRSLIEADEDGRALWWSNADGWTVRQGATVFSEGEARTFAAVPAGATWEAV